MKSRSLEIDDAKFLERKMNKNMIQKKVFFTFGFPTQVPGNAA